ncbi:MAG: DNA polymerase IV [Granulosicoccus sp.]|nr:DNA polymerase IV [Granulosicoccus sp.]
MEAGDELKLRKIIHVDMDAFYASVEQRDDPLLRGRPVIVGGQPNGRGVVAACSYEARAFGIHSAMPSVEAGRRCPQAAFVKPRFPVYKQASQQIHAVFREFTDQIEPLSLDEAYLDVSRNSLFGGSAVRLAREIKTMILDRTGLVASAGVSYNKFLAKIASDHDKPDGLFCILPEAGEAFVATLPIGRFHGVGKVTEARMHELGIHTGGDLRQWSEAELTREFGRSSQYYYRVARGIDHRPVRTSRTRKSMGAERTFGDNIRDRAEMLTILTALSTDLMRQLEEKSLGCRTLTVKVRFADFSTFTRAHSSSKGLLDKGAAERALPFLLDRALAMGHQPSPSGKSSQRAGVRLLGIAFSALLPLSEELPVQLEMDWQDPQ